VRLGGNWFEKVAEAEAERAVVDGTADDGLWTRGLLSRRSLADGKLAFFTTWCPAGTAAEKLVQVEGCRWAIEDSFECAETELGLDLRAICNPCGSEPS
jgi:SRSO17 transposase